jgi:hypothetical protein
MQPERWRVKNAMIGMGSCRDRAPGRQQNQQNPQQQQT